MHVFIIYLKKSESGVLGDSGDVHSDGVDDGDEADDNDGDDWKMIY